MINFTDPIEETFKKTNPNFDGTGRITLDFIFSDEEIEEMKERALEKVEKKMHIPKNYDGRVQDCGAYIEITQHKFNVKGRITVFENNAMTEYSDIRLSEDERTTAFNEVAKAAGGLENLQCMIKYIQLGAEREKVIEKIPETKQDYEILEKKNKNFKSKDIEMGR